MLRNPLGIFTMFAVLILVLPACETNSNPVSPDPQFTEFSPYWDDEECPTAEECPWPWSDDEDACSKAPPGSWCSTISGIEADRLQLALRYYSDQGDNYCNQMESEILDALQEGDVVSFNVFNNDDGTAIGGWFMDPGEVAITRSYTGYVLAHIAIHEGYHMWLGNDMQAEGEESDAQYWANRCVGPLS